MDKPLTVHGGQNVIKRWTVTCVLEDVQSGPGRKAEWKVFQAGGTVCVKAQRPKRTWGLWEELQRICCV